MATNTTATTQTHNGTGSQANFAISFSFLADSEVDVTVGGVLKTLGTHYTITGSTLTFTSGNIPPSGTGNIKFTRDTNISTKKVDFTDGSVLTETDLDTNADQILFAQQEITDKLGGIEEGATADQTDAEIRTAVENASDSNVFTDADHSKLNAIEAGATGDQTASEIRTLVESASDSNVFTDADHSKLNGIESGATADQTNAEIRAAVEAASDSNVFTDADHTKLNGIETGATADQTVSEIKSLIAGSPLDASHLAANSVTTSEIADAELTTLAGMQSGTASKLADSTALTSDIADLNQLDGMAKQTTITDDDTKFPTSGAVVDFVAAQIAPIGGLEVIANEDSFPTTQPSSGVVISISDIEGLIVNGSGVATNARTSGNGSDNVTINGFPSSLQSKTMAAGLGLMVSSTGSSQTYTYHKLLAKEEDVEQLSNDINDFASRYRVGSSNPTSDNDAGDLFFNTSTNKLLVFNGTSNAYEEAQSIGNFFISTLSPAFDGSTQNFTVTNAPANVQQIILSINGVVQKPNSGTSTPSEGFALDGNTIKLAAAPASGSDAFVIVMGSTVNIGTPSNNTVTSAILQNGSVVEAKLGSNAVTNAKVSASAAIAGTKISPDFGSQNIVTTGSITGNDLEIDSGTLSVDASNNRVGIGTTSPNKLLHIQDAAISQGYSSQSSTLLVLEDSGDTSLEIASGHNNKASIFFGDTGASNKGQINYLHGSSGDAMSFHANGSERMRIDSSGNVGIGTTSPAELLHLQSTAGNTKLRLTQSGSSTDAVNGAIHFGNSTDGQLCEIRGYTSGSNNSGFLEFRTTSSGSDVTAMTITTSGNVGIGTTSPSSFNADGRNLVVGTGSGGQGLSIYSANNNFGNIYFADGTSDGSYNAGGILYNHSSNFMRFDTAAGERMRIDSVGKVGINVTAPDKMLEVNNAGITNHSPCLIHASGSDNIRVLGLRSSRASGGTNAQMIEFFNSSGSVVGSITSHGSSTGYNTSSDYRLKENVTAISDGITRLKTLKPSRFNFKADKDTTVDGFLAHEVTAVPEAVTGTKDQVATADDVNDEIKEGDPIYQGIDQSKLVPLLTAALQEAIAKIEVLETKVAALGG